MKVLTDDRQISIAATASPLSASFPLANVNTDRPRQEYIADASSDTITVSCAADASNAVDAIFISGTMFDSATYTLKDTGGSTVETSSFTASDITSSNNNGNANTLNTFYKNQSRVQYPEFVSFTNAQTANCSVDLALSSTTDRKALQIEGNAIASWDQNSGATGRFLDSASNAINLENHGQIYVGSLISNIDSSINNPTDGNNYTITSATSLGTPFTITSGDTVTVSGGGTITNPSSGNETISTNSSTTSPYTITASDTITIDSGVTVTVGGEGVVLTILATSGDVQILQWAGDGTAAGSVTLGSALSSMDVNSIFNPLKIGIIRCGTSSSYSNPRVGYSKSFVDYSISRPLSNGGFSYTQRNVAKTQSFSLVIAATDWDTWQAFFYAYRNKPFAILSAVGMPAGQNEKTRFSSFCYMATPPSVSWETADYVNVEITLKEVL